MTSRQIHGTRHSCRQSDYVNGARDENHNRQEAVVGDRTVSHNSERYATDTLQDCQRHAFHTSGSYERNERQQTGPNTGQHGDRSTCQRQQTGTAKARGGSKLGTRLTTTPG